VIRHQLAVLVRTRAALAPAAAFLFVLLGVYAYRGSGVGSTYAFTALLLCPVMAWLAAAAAFAEPLTQQQVAMAAAGGPRRALRGRVLALAAVGAGLAFVVIVVYAVLAVPLYDLAPVLSPVAWLAASLTDAAPHTLGAAVVLGALVALVQSALALVAGEALRRRAG
jgi:hypothetical protein